MRDTNVQDVEPLKEEKKEFEQFVGVQWFAKRHRRGRAWFTFAQGEEAHIWLKVEWAPEHPGVREIQ